MPCARVIRPRNILTVLALTAVVLVTACGSDDNAASEPASVGRVTASDRVFTIDDLKSGGFKTSKEYDVTDLPGATGAWFGFLRIESEPRDFEVRLYASHDDAVSLGQEFAAEASGPDAKLEEETASWIVGLKDRKRLSSGGSADLAAWSGSVQTKYGDYLILGNMVLLCEGADSEESLANCADFVAAIP